MNELDTARRIAADLEVFSDYLVDAANFDSTMAAVDLYRLDATITTMRDFAEAAQCAIDSMINDMENQDLGLDIDNPGGSQ